MGDDLPPLPEPDLFDVTDDNFRGYSEAQMRAYAEQAVKQERAACARACLDLKAPDLDHAPGEYHRFDITTAACAAAIRARSEQ